MQYVALLTSEKLIDYEKVLKGLMEEGLDFLKKLIIAIVFFVIGKKLIRFIMKVIESYFNKINVEVSVSGFLIAFIRALLYILLITIIVVPILGIDKSTIIALIGSAGLSIGLALQGGLSNFAGGVLILLLKPFKVGDYIITNGNEGKVTAIDIFYTKLLTIDNRLLVMPNGALSNTNIINVTNEPERRLDINVSINSSENIDRVKEILYNLAKEHEFVLQDQPIDLFVSGFEQNVITLGYRMWVLNENYWPLKWYLLEKIKLKFDENNISMQFSQMNINIKK